MYSVKFCVLPGDFARVSSILALPGVFSVSIIEDQNKGDELLMYRVLEIICMQRNVKITDVLAFNRKTEVKMARHIFFYLVTDMRPDWNHRLLANFMNRHRTIVIHSRDFIHRRIVGRVSRIAENRDLATDIQNIKTLIHGSREIQRQINQDYGLFISKFASWV